MANFHHGLLRGFEANHFLPLPVISSIGCLDLQPGSILHSNVLKLFQSHWGNGESKEWPHVGFWFHKVVKL